MLLVEDNPAEARLTTEALGETQFRHEMCLVGDGEQATAFLRREGVYADAFRPDLIFLDLNLPGKGGRQVLAEVKSEPLLESIPIIVFSNSQAPEDIVEVYRLRANCYLVKPPEIDEFFSMMRRMVDFWRSTSSLSNHADANVFPVYSDELISA